MLADVDLPVSLRGGPICHVSRGVVGAVEALVDIERGESCGSDEGGVGVTEDEREWSEDTSWEDFAPGNLLCQSTAAKSTGAPVFDSLAKESTPCPGAGTERPILSDAMADPASMA